MGIESDYNVNITDDFFEWKMNRFQYHLDGKSGRLPDFERAEFLHKNCLKMKFMLAPVGTTEDGTVITAKERTLDDDWNENLSYFKDRETYLFDVLIIKVIDSGDLGDLDFTKAMEWTAEDIAKMKPKFAWSIRYAEVL